MNINDLVKSIKFIYKNNPEKINCFYLYHSALNFNFGCIDCLVVFNKTEMQTDENEYKLPALFYSTFDDPNFNPRWEHGTADYIEIINLNDLI